MLSNEKSLTQNERKNSIKLIFILQLIKISIRFDAKLAKLMRNKRDILIKLIFMFKLIDIQIVISKKIINDVSDNFYEKSKKSIKFLIKKFQVENQ